MFRFVVAPRVRLARLPRRMCSRHTSGAEALRPQVLEAWVLRLWPAPRARAARAARADGARGRRAGRVSTRASSPAGITCPVLVANGRGAESSTVRAIKGFD
jgi:hypothetical protein